MAQSPNEISETRLLLVFLLMGAIMFLTPYFFKSAPPPQKKGAATSQTAPPPAAATQPAAASTQAEPEAAPVAAPTSPATDQKAAPPMVIDTEVFRITFSNQGATVRSWVLKKYKGNDGKPLDLVATLRAGDRSVDEPLGWLLEDARTLRKFSDRVLSVENFNEEAAEQVFDAV